MICIDDNKLLKDIVDVYQFFDVKSDDTDPQLIAQEKDASYGYPKLPGMYKENSPTITNRSS